MKKQLSGIMKKFLVLSLLVTFCTNVHAVLITGELAWAGLWSEDTTSNVLTFHPSLVLGATHDFASAGIVAGQSISMSSIDLDGLSGSLSLWSLNGFTYTIHTLFVAGTSPFYDITANGWMTHMNYDATEYFMQLSTNGGSYSATAVPEPATLSLLGIGLLMVGLFSRHRKKLPS